MIARSQCLMTVGLLVLCVESLPAETLVNKDDYGPCGQVSLYCAAAEGIWLIDPPFHAMQITRDSFQAASTNRFLYLAKDEHDAQQIAERFGNKQHAVLFAILAASFAIVASGALLYSWKHITHAAWHTTKAVQAIAYPRTAATRWRAFFAGLALLAAVVGALFLGPHGISSASPELHVSREFIDLGVVLPGEQSLDIVLENRGGKALSFSKPTTPCNCTDAEVPESLAAGSEGLLRLSVLMSPGPGGSEILLHSNDPAGAKRIGLSWTGMTKPILSPSRVICDSAPLQQDYEQVMTLFCTDGGTPDTSPSIDLYSSSPAVDVSLIEATSTKSQVATSVPPDLLLGVDRTCFAEKQLLVRIKAPNGPELVAPRCWLEIKYKTFSEKIDVPVAVRFVRDVVPKHDQIVFSSVSFNELRGMKRTVPLEISDKGVDVTIGQSPPWVNASLVRSSAGDAAVEIEVSKDVSKACNGKIILQTSHGEVPIAVELFALESP